eukprot:gene15898-biopygen12275
MQLFRLVIEIQFRVTCVASVQPKVPDLSLVFFHGHDEPRLWPFCVIILPMAVPLPERGTAMADVLLLVDARASVSASCCAATIANLMFFAGYTKKSGQTCAIPRCEL